MFKFLKDKLKAAVSRFTEKAEETVEEEAEKPVVEEKAEEVSKEELPQPEQRVLTEEFEKHR